MITGTVSPNLEPIIGICLRGPAGASAMGNECLVGMGLMEGFDLQIRLHERYRRGCDRAYESAGRRLELAAA